MHPGYTKDTQNNIDFFHNKDVENNIDSFIPKIHKRTLQIFNNNKKDNCK